MLTQERLKEFLSYDPETGVFVRMESTERTKIGDVAGCKKPDGYLCIGIDSKSHLMHRLAFLYMTGSFPKHHTDHINGVRDDNRWVNLRDITQAENNKNTKISIRNTSGAKGVAWLEYRGKWQAVITVNYKSISLGCFVDFDDAVAAKRKADIKYGFHENHGRK